MEEGIRKEKPEQQMCNQKESVGKRQINVCGALLFYGLFYCNMDNNSYVGPLFIIVLCCAPARNVLLIFGPGSWAFGPGRVCRFMRIFVRLAIALNSDFGCGIRFSAVDAAFSKHMIYKDGLLHVLTTRDGNNRVLPLAWAVCETESADTYLWFSQQCHAAGLGRYLTANSVVYSDRMKGIEHFFGLFNAYHAHCFKHILDNCKSYIKGSHTTFSDKTAWDMRSANTVGAFRHHLGVIRASSPLTANYFEHRVDHDRTYQYRLNALGVATHGFKTSQIVECLNAVFVEARHFTPYRLNNYILAWVGKQFDARLHESALWIEKGQVLTPWARRLFAIEVRVWWGPGAFWLGGLAYYDRLMHVWALLAMQTEYAKRTGLVVTPGGGGELVFYVENLQTADHNVYEVDFRRGLASVKCCHYATKHKLPCKHMVPIFHSRGMMATQRKARATILKFWSRWALADNYRDMYRGKQALRPKISNGPFVGPVEDELQAPVQTQRKRGRPKKARYKCKPKTVKTVADWFPQVYHPQYARVLQFI